MRVLVSIKTMNYGASPFFYLIQALKAQFEFVVITYDQAIIDECNKLGLESYHIIRKSSPNPNWLERFLIALPVLGSRFNDARDEYQRQQRWQHEANQVVERLNPDVIIVSGDFNYIEFYLCQFPHIPTVLPQITMAWIHVQNDLKIIEYKQGKKGEIMRGIIGALSRLTGRQFLARVKDHVYLPHGSQVWISLGAWLGGLRFQSPVKGGTAADYVCLNGEHFRKTYTELGVPSHKLVVTGSPTHDSLLETSQAFDQAQQEAFRTKLGIPPNAILVAFFLQPPETHLQNVDYTSDVKTLITQTLAASDDVWIVAKFHPIQYRQKYQKTYQALEASERVIVIAAEDHSDDSFNTHLLLCSRLMVTPSSTVGYSALAFEIPLITYAFYEQLADYYFSEIGGSRHVQKREDFRPALEELLFDETARQALQAEQRKVRQNHMLLDGQCCQRIGKVIRQAHTTHESSPFP